METTGALREEKLRQDEAKTEQRLVMMKAYQGATGGIRKNPLNGFFANDKEVMRLDVDVNAHKEFIWNSTVHSPEWICPIMWPGCICLPLKIYWRGKNAEESAKAHRLILKERCLVLEVDPYKKNSYYWLDTPIKETIPLEDIKSCEVETCKAQSCGKNIAADTFVVRLKYGIQFPIFAVDFPGKNAQEFAEQLMAQVNACSANPSALPVQWNEYKKIIGKMGVGMQNKQQMMIAMQMANMNTPLAAQNMTRGGVDAASAVSCISPAQPQAAQVAIPVADAIEKEDAATKLEKLANLKAQGILSEDEFKAAKKAILGNLSVVRPSAPAAC